MSVVDGRGWSRVDEDGPPLGRDDERGVSLAHVEEVDVELPVRRAAQIVLRAGWSRRGGRRRVLLARRYEQQTQQRQQARAHGSQSSAGRRSRAAAARLVYTLRSFVFARA